MLRPTFLVCGAVVIIVALSAMSVMARRDASLESASTASSPMSRKCPTDRPASQGQGRMKCAVGTAGDFDSYQFSTQIGCNGELRTLHGLWPSYKPARKGYAWPQYCETPFVFKTSKIPSDLRLQMDTFYKSCPRGGAVADDKAQIRANEQFWRHEWDRHGTCSGYSPEAFFRLTVAALHDPTIKDRVTGECKACGVGKPVCECNLNLTKAEVAAIADRLSATPMVLTAEKTSGPAREPCPDVRPEAQSEADMFCSVGTPGDFEEYELATQVGCGAGRTLHGLWPNYGSRKRNGYDWPQFCDAEPFDAAKLPNDLVELLDEHWKSCPGETAGKTQRELNLAFWKHEWDRHGSCSGLGLEDFFRTGLATLLSSDVQRVISATAECVAPCASGGRSCECLVVLQHSDVARIRSAAKVISGTEPEDSPLDTITWSSISSRLRDESFARTALLTVLVLAAAVLLALKRARLSGGR